MVSQSPLYVRPHEKVVSLLIFAPSSPSTVISPPSIGSGGQGEHT